MPGVINSDIFAYSTAIRDSITKEQEQHIKDLYKKWSEDVQKQADYYASHGTPSSPLSSVYYQQLYSQMQEQSKQVSNSIYTNIQNGMFGVSDAVVKDAVDWMSGFGFKNAGLSAAFSYIPQSTVNALVTGSVYGNAGSWSLSSAIWGDNEKTLRDIYAIVAQGVAEQMPIGDMAKLLSDYVNPSKQLQWAGPGGIKIYKHAVDYNAQRLARTLVQHTYQQSFVAATKDNPFVLEYVWLANGSRVCPICADRDGAHFKKDKLPLDHPNGMCTMEPVVDGKMVDKLANWVNDPDGTYPEIDAFAKNFGYDASKMPKMTLDDIKKKYGNSSYKSPRAWYKKLPDDVQKTVTQIHQSSGKGWTQWYQDEIMDQALKPGANAANTVKAAKKAEKAVAKEVNKTVKVSKKAAEKADDADDLVKAAKKAVEDLDNQKKVLEQTKKTLDSEIALYSKEDLKGFKKVIKACDKDGVSGIFDYVDDTQGFLRRKEFSGMFNDIYVKYKDDMIDELWPSLNKMSPMYKDSAARRRLVATYLNDYSKLSKIDGIADELDDLFSKFFGMNSKQYDLFNKLDDELKTVKSKLSIIKSDINVQKAISKGATKEFAGKSYEEAMAWFKSQSVSFYKNEIVKKSDDFIEALDDIMTKAKTDDAAKAFKKYSSGSIKSEKFDALLDKLDDYKSGKVKIESTLTKFSSEDFTDEAKLKAKLFGDRNIADKYLRKWLDDNWDILDDDEKFAVWKYTENSHPINKPLSGYAHGSWDRKNFVGVGNADWGTEDSWRTLGFAFAKKFGKNGTSNVDHAKAIADLSRAIDNFEMPDSMFLFRGSDYNGLAGWFEGSGFGFDDMLDIIKNGSESDLKAFEGMTIQNHAFTSTGIASDAGFGGNVKYKIYAPKGTRGIYAEPQSYYGDTVGTHEKIYSVGQKYSSVGGEAEVILQRGTEFRIVSIKRSGQRIDIELEIVDQPRYFESGYEQTIDGGMTVFEH